GHFRTTDNHGVGIAAGDQPRTQADVVGTRGTGSGDRQVRALEAELDGQGAGDHVDDRPGHKERRDLARTGTGDGVHAVLDPGDAADARAGGHTDAQGVVAGTLQAGVTHGLDAGGDAVEQEFVEAPGFLARPVLANVEVPDRSAEAGRIDADVKVCDGCDAAAAFANTRPGVLDGVAQGRDRSQAGYYHSSA